MTELIENRCSKIPINREKPEAIAPMMPVTPRTRLLGKRMIRALSTVKRRSHKKTP
ncbi:hypothetical protein NG791_03800 [Laspinema sp. D1]|uniref:hypothetical protein n=1 Tax=Laspinema palackyanum TaxID=3231601 RepID=UPI003481719B|nr:hypothetical protein [Laspinema sp. D2b]